tara:strand:- start:1785 stop:1928 length:144 start_codon:yes stop_codon:yes gene_type:complete
MMIKQFIKKVVNTLKSVSSAGLKMKQNHGVIQAHLRPFPGVVQFDNP